MAVRRPHDQGSATGQAQVIRQQAECFSEMFAQDIRHEGQNHLMFSANQTQISAPTSPGSSAHLRIHAASH